VIDAEGVRSTLSRLSEVTLVPLLPA